MEDNLIMVSYLKSGRCWWILRIFDNETFDVFFSSTQPVYDKDVLRQQYNFNELDKVVLVGELRDWISGFIR